MNATTRDAALACARWLQKCLSFGWKHEDLDCLEAIWWEHHDERGRLKRPART